jgi:D-3-phosphoglycerate dehydrogenase
MPRKPIILSLTTMHDSGMSRLRDAGEVRMASSLLPKVLHQEIADADALVIRTAGEINAALMDHAPNLRVIGRHGVGYDQVDVPAATERGIQVVYTPGANTEAVAEHVFAMMIGVSKHFPRQSIALVEGRYNDRTKLVGRDIYGKTLGIVGFGRIGRRVATIAKLGFGMTVLYNDIVGAPSDVEAISGAKRVSFDEILAKSDYLTLHVPLDSSTRGMINREAIAKLKPNAILINTCRGPVVDEQAVASALDSKHLFGYGADVYAIEPPEPGHPLIGRPDCLLTPHSAAQTVESLTNMATEVAVDVINVLSGRAPLNPVNAPDAVAESRRRLGKLPLSEGLL